jgi:DNA-3-methyladenine glycosylase II
VGKTCPPRQEKLDSRTRKQVYAARARQTTMPDHDKEDSAMTVHLNTQADLDRAVLALVEQDPRLQPVLKLAGMPALRRRDPGYAGLAAIVCGQQLSTASAAAIWARVSAAFDPFHHDALRRARTDRLGRLGLSGAKIRTLKNLARELAAERLNLEALANEEADAAHKLLTALHGIGPWTADVYLLFCLGHGDAWPAGDLAVQEAVKLGLGLKTRPTARQMAPLAEPWRPLRGAAAHLWWTYYRALKKREGVIGASEKANAVLNKSPVAKATSAKIKIRRAKQRDPKK